MHKWTTNGEVKLLFNGKLKTAPLYGYTVCHYHAIIIIMVHQIEKGKLALIILL